MSSLANEKACPCTDDMVEKTLLDYWLLLYSRKWIILIITLSAVATAWVISVILPPVYEAKAVFFVPKEQDTATFYTPPAGSMARSPLTPVPNEDPQAPYIGILKSKAVADLVQKEFPHKSVSDLMRKDLDFVLTNEYLIEVYSRDRDPVKAAGIANAYVKYFNQLMAGYSLPAQSKTQIILEGEISDNQQKLFQAQESLEAFMERSGTANIDEETKQLIIHKANFESQLDKARVEYNENSTKLIATEKKLKEESIAFKPSEFIITSPFLEKLRSQLIDVETRMSSLGVEIKESHPEYIALKKNHEEIKKNIDREIERIVNSQIKGPDTFFENLRRQMINLYVDRERIEANMEGTQKVLEGIEIRIQEIPSLKSRLDVLISEVDGYRGVVDKLKLNLEEVKAQTKKDPQVGVTVEQATPPQSPSFPILGLNIIVAFLAGLVGGVFYCFFVNYIEETMTQRLYRLLKAIESSEG